MQYQKMCTSINQMSQIIKTVNNKISQNNKKKPADIKTGSYFDYGVEYNDKDLKFKVGDPVRISKYRNAFVKGYTPNWSEEALVIEKVKRHFPMEHTLLMISIVKKLLEYSMKQSCRRQFKKNSGLKK